MKKYAIIPLILFSVFSAAGNIYLGHKVLASGGSAVDESQKFIAAAGKLMELPANETPTVARVGDPEQLKEQGLFTNAELQDVVLIYPVAKRAILYRPSTNKIIEVTPVNVTEANEAAPAPAPTPAPAPEPTPAPIPSPTPVPVTP